jgi:hypothetical protein
MKIRQFRIYGVGTAKSGTHSIAGMFQPHYRAGHEPDYEQMISMIVRKNACAVNEEQVATYIRERDLRLLLEVDSSQLNYFMLDTFLEQFPAAKFILTIRDSYSWLASFMNHQLAWPIASSWLKLRTLRFGRSRFQFCRAERVLESNGLYTLDSYLSYWTRHNEEILRKVPSEKLLVLRTHEMSTRLDKIAEFVGVGLKTLNFSRSHSFRAEKKFEVLSKIDRHFLEERVRVNCGRLMDELFPGFGPEHAYS